MRIVTTFLSGLLVALLLGCRAIPPEQLSWPSGPSDLARGQYLVSSLAACGFCHGISLQPGSPLQGGRMVSDGNFQALAANITPAVTGIGGWSALDFMRLMRGGLRPDGSRTTPGVHDGYEWMAEADLLALAAYIRSVPAVEHQVSRPELEWGEETVRNFWKPLREVRGFVPEVEPRFVAVYGEYLVDHVARCSSCHSAPIGLLGGGEYLAGGRTIKNGSGERIAPGITGSRKSGIGGWTEADIISFLESGRTPGGRLVDPEFCPTGFYQRADRDDLTAIARYLKSQAE